MARSVPVVVPLPLDGPFDYALPPDLRVAPGDLVEVPFGPRGQVIGAVWDARAAEVAGAPVPPARLKPIQRRLDAPPLGPPLRRLIEHVAAVTLAPLGSRLEARAERPGRARAGDRPGSAWRWPMTPARPRR